MIFNGLLLYGDKVNYKTRSAIEDNDDLENPMGKFVDKKYPVLGDRGMILRTKQSGDVWQLRMRIPAEKKYVRESLRTKDLETAVMRAEKRVLEILSDVASGRKIFGITLRELVELYVNDREEDVRKDDSISSGTISAGRLVTIKSQLKHFLKYKGEDTKVAELDSESCYEYARWCRHNRKNVRDVTIRNEQATFNHMMRFAYRKGLSHFQYFDFRPIRIVNDETTRRGVFTFKQYDHLYHVMRKWAHKDSCPDKQTLLERLMIRDCVLIGSNTMLRVGELWQLKWKDIKRIYTDHDEQGRKVDLVVIHVRPETSKKRVGREITTRGGYYFKRLKRRSKFTDPDDYVFCGETGQHRYPKKKFYDAWHELMDLAEIDYKDEKLTWYSLRHFGVTCRLMAGSTAFEVGKVAGTGTTFIDNHYGHLNEEMSRNVALKNFYVHKHGITEKK